jgi:dihydroorotate dehydrogenase electron transfer subunit
LGATRTTGGRTRLTSPADLGLGVEAAQLLESREVLPGERLLTWHAPSLARRIQPGQYLHVRRPAPRGLLPCAVPVAGLDRVAGTLELLVGTRPGLAELGALRVSDSAAFEGPLGRGFEVDARSRHLLVVSDRGGLPRVRSLLADAVGAGRRVTLLLGARTAADVWPSSLLPDEVEYVVATEDGSLGHAGVVSELLPGYEAWADQCFAAGSWALLETLSMLARGRDARLGVARLGRRRARRVDPAPRQARRRSWLQVALPHEASCALGVCLGCVVIGTEGPLRVCREGPVLGFGAVAWERQR